MTQTLTLVPPSPPRDGFGSIRATASVGPQDEARRACELFFARTAAVGPASEDDRRAVIGSVTEILKVGSDGLVPVPLRSTSQLQLIVEGWAYRAHTLQDGARQITDVLLPGDVLGCSTKASRGTEHEIRACGRAEVALLRRDIFNGRELPSLRRRWEWVRDAEARVLRSRLVSLGRRDARERVAHFLAELHRRLHQVGLAEGGAFMCPLTQEQLADVLGLTGVHVNRVLQRLRSEGLVIVNRPRVVIPDLARLHAAAGFYEHSGG